MGKNKPYFAMHTQGCEMRASPQGEGEGKRTVSGYAMRFEVPTVLFSVDGVDYIEIIDRNALAGCDMNDVVFDRGHAMEDKLLARTSNNSLRLSVDDNGLVFEADIADTQDGRDCYELIKRGDINGCSFAAIVAEESYDRETHTRRILRFSALYDVAAVTFPAYPNTEITAELRSAFGVDAEPEIDFQKQKMLMSL
jgi:uncharacterized protein